MNGKSLFLNGNRLYQTGLSRSARRNKARRPICHDQTRMTQLELPNSFPHRSVEFGSSCHIPSTMNRYWYVPGSRYTTLSHNPGDLLLLLCFRGCEFLSQLLKLPARYTLIASGAVSLNVTRFFIFFSAIPSSLCSRTPRTGVPPVNTFRAPIWIVVLLSHGLM
jgi:hypothetical protein